MAEPTRFTSLEADAGGLPTFTTPSSIFDIPNTLLGGFPIGADAGMGFLQGAGPTFTAPSTGDFTFSFGAPGSMAPVGLSLADQLSPWNIRTDINQLAPNWGTWNPSTDVTTAADFSGVKLTGTPFSNVGIDQTAISGGRPTVTAGSEISTTAAQGGAVQLDPFEVSETRVQTGPVVNLSDIYTPRVTGGEGLLGGVTTGATGEGAVVLSPYVVTESKKSSQGPTISTEITPSSTPSSIAGYRDTGEAIMMDPVTVTGTKSPLSTLTPEEQARLVEAGRTNFGLTPAVQLPPVVVTGKKDPGTGVNIKYAGDPNVPPPSTDVFIPPSTKSPFGPSTPPSTKSGGTLPSTPTATGTTPTSATPTTTTTSSAMTERDLAKELEKTMAAFNQYRPQIQSMYGDLYQQFMPKGLTAAEPGIINQYQADLARLQQRQAGMLSPEDIRQSQQSAREAYGARGQVMGPGAIGAEILNREAIRQQREDQARAALQSSYGNVLNMANLQTGNLFSPIASLMSSTFNPLGSYPADVYGTNVNAQLARDIAQKNYEAAIRSAELQGSAAKSAANTSLFGDFFKTAVGVKVYVNCMPGDQVIDTPVGPAAVESIKGGDEVIGYDGSVAKVLQVCSYVQDGDKDFFTFHLSNGGKITVCDRHKIMDIPASEWVVGATMGDAIIERIDRKSGITTSYDLVTEVSGYRIAGVPVNSMIPEMLALTLQLVALKQIA